ncbi:hypothetical protein [Achromobacter aloeverae]|uniref:Uncharacterized protein n=1 Tax=Achromobacter aloeverae TaxID=1750518 RepID=A0A4Q1HL33_9BURK|nr:hypothetical protein [Achromobacter aloeverae]RXN88015.1 hypothetical protein C7R54_15680 [Achromobacter aloeverae]
MATIPTGFPLWNTPFLDPSGRVAEVWIRFLLTLWDRTGGGSGEIPDTLTIEDVLSTEALFAAPSPTGTDAFQSEMAMAPARDEAKLLEMIFAPVQSTEYTRSAYSLPMPPTSPWTYTAGFRQGFYLSGGSVSSFVLQRGPMALPLGNSGADIADQTFVAGTDFTPGSTTSLTLSQSFGAKQRLWVFFDGVFQGDDQYSLSGTSLTFTSAIPVGVSSVYVKGLSLSAAGLGTQLIELNAGDIVSLTYSSVPAVTIIPR